MTEGPHFLHVDMDAFYASVEVLDDPRLVGLPVIVGGEGARGVVASCSYEARMFGVRSAMSSSQARRRCPQAVFRAGRFDRYNEVSAQLHGIFADFTPLVEGISLDEAFLDLSGATRLFGPAAEVAAVIRRRVLDELGLACSVGVAATMVMAKLASKAAKPTATASGIQPGSGVFVVAPGEELAFLQPMPVEALWGVGPVTAGRLHRIGIATVGQIGAMSPDVLESVLGRSHGRHLHDLSLGIDPRQVDPDRAVKSIGHEETYARDRYDRDDLAREVLRMADAVASRMRAQPVLGRTVTLKVRHADFSTITRSRTLDAPTDLARDITRAATDLLDALDLSPGVRLLGVSVANLSAPAPYAMEEQLSLPIDPPPNPTAPGAGGSDSEPAPTAAWTAAAVAVAEVRQRYGDAAVGPAALLEADGLRVRRRGDSPWGPPEPRDPIGPRSRE